MPKIAISYRHSDTAAISGRIFDRLIDRFGEHSVFIDIDNIPFGVDFRGHIKDVLQNTDVLIAVNGSRWIAQDEQGNNRLNQRSDIVRMEIEIALERGVPIIPVLVDGARMPGEGELPDSLKNFVYINAAPVDTGRDFRQHMDRVIRSIEKVIGAAKPVHTPTPRSALKRLHDLYSTRPSTLGVAMFVLLIVLAASVSPGPWSSWIRMIRGGDPVVNAGGKIGAVNVVLTWDTLDDLDLRVVCPDRSVIDFQRRRNCGGGWT
jgi:hypothetical protein